MATIQCAACRATGENVFRNGPPVRKTLTGEFDNVTLCPACAEQPIATVAHSIRCQARLDVFRALAEHGTHAWLYREALEQDYIDPTLACRTSGVYYCRHFVGEPERQLRCYLNESLLTALTHYDPLIRLRATLQAYSYAGRLGGMGSTPGPRHSDALLEARNQIEAFLLEHAPHHETSPDQDVFPPGA